jgi:AcrR family transcriptional regulator
MPKSPRTQEERNNIKENILDTALSLITDEGFRNLSMRKIASRLGVTATTIYNYYSNRDELYFMIRTHGFELLYRSLGEAYRSHDTPRERLKACIQHYFQFGIDYPDYYDVMFVNKNVPKYLESIGTELEEAASLDKEAGLKTLFFIVRLFKELYAGDPSFTDKDARYFTIGLWCELNGIVSLRNSRLLSEVEDNVEDLTERLISDAYNRFKE